MKWDLDFGFGSLPSLPLSFSLLSSRTVSSQSRQGCGGGFLIFAEQQRGLLLDHGRGVMMG